MRIGVPRETKDREFRVGLVPGGVRGLVSAGHEVWVERGAGEGSGLSDPVYTDAGARLVDAQTAWSADLVVKVKEPTPPEFSYLRRDQVLFTYLHLAAAPALARALVESGARAIAYETMRHPDGTFPVLAPMSEVAGCLAVQIGAGLLQKESGGKGLLLGGVPGVRRGRVTILGAGTVGINALRIAKALGADVDILDIDLARLSYVYDLFHGGLDTLYSNPANVERSVVACDLLVGAVYVSGRRAPTLVPETLVAAMAPGSVIVDVAVDQGGCIETIHVTTHSNPTYRVHSVVHYGVANMPGAVPVTSTLALTNATQPFVERIAAQGADAAVRDDPILASGANVWRGEIVCRGVAESLDRPYRELSELLSRELHA